MRETTDDDDDGDGDDGDDGGQRRGAGSDRARAPQRTKRTSVRRTRSTFLPANFDRSAWKRWNSALVSTGLRATSVVWPSAMPSWERTSLSRSAEPFR